MEYISNIIRNKSRTKTILRELTENAKIHSGSCHLNKMQHIGILLIKTHLESHLNSFLQIGTFHGL